MHRDRLGQTANLINFAVDLTALILATKPPRDSSD
jgi:hypothetical protein